MAHSFKRTIALLMAGAFVLTACSTSAPASRSDSANRQGAASDRQSPGEIPYGPGQQPGGQGATAPVGLDVGKRAPSFTVTALDGRQISDADLQAAGKPYILYFYATW
jgi:cytochrome oxidase Cu insertion factor (SCO1/SenC/PrrC family)